MSAALRRGAQDPLAVPHVRRSGRRVRHTVASALRRLPEYVRLLGRLMRDRRVSRVDRGLVLATIVYVATPLDFIPDFIPFVGEVDDLFLLVISLTRLFEKAGRDVLLSHWRRDPAELDPGWLRKIALAASVFMPRSTRRRLRRFAAST